MDHLRGVDDVDKVAELPQLLRNPAVLKEITVRLERIDFARTKSLECILNSVQQGTQLLLVKTWPRPQRRGCARTAAWTRRSADARLYRPVSAGEAGLDAACQCDGAGRPTGRIHSAERVATSGTRHERGQRGS
jgi:hypothetical protein